MSAPRPLIAYITLEDASDRRSLSGAPFYVGKSLQKHVGDVDYIGPLKSNYEFPLKILSKFIYIATLGKRQYRWYNNKILSSGYGRILTKRIAAKKYDLIVAPGGSVFLPYLNTRVPIIYMSDATFRIMIGYHSAFRNLLNICLREGDDAEKRSVDMAALALYSSAWAANSAINDYKAKREKIRIIPYGANIDDTPAREYVIKKRVEKGLSRNKCSLLFLGVDWEGKGGAIAYETVLELREKGINANLTICGCVPPKQYQIGNVNIIPFLDKNKQGDRERFNEIMMEADFLLLPTRFECFGHVFCEANSYGLPAITTDTGGVSSVVRNGINGYILPWAATGKDYAEIICNVHKDRDLYHKLVKRSRDEYDTRLNWDAWGLHARKEIKSMLNDRRNN